MSAHTLRRPGNDFRLIHVRTTLDKRSGSDHGDCDLIAASAALTARRADPENLRTRSKAGIASLAAGPISSIASMVLMSP